MLSNLNAIPTVGVRNLQVAKNFYEGKLGLKPLDADPAAMKQQYKSGNSIIEVYQTESAGTSKSTALSWVVGDKIKEEVEGLKSRGISFEHYSMPNCKLEGDIHVMGDIKAAWFKDPDGNILCVGNH